MSKSKSIRGDLKRLLESIEKAEPSRQAPSARHHMPESPRPSTSEASHRERKRLLDPFTMFIWFTSWFALVGFSGCWSQVETDVEDPSDKDAGSFADSMTKDGTGSSGEPGSDSDSDTGEPGDDTDYYQIRIKPEYDMAGEHGDQGTLYTYTIATCENDRFSLREDAYPYIWIMVFFHDDYDLVGTHLPRAEDDGGYQHGFLARYNPDAHDDEAGPWDPYLVAESGTVKVFDVGDEQYEMAYDLVFSDEIHEAGEMHMMPCDSPWYDI